MSGKRKAQLAEGFCRALAIEPGIVRIPLRLMYDSKAPTVARRSPSNAKSIVPRRLRTGGPGSSDGSKPVSWASTGLPLARKQALRSLNQPLFVST